MELQDLYKLSNDLKSKAEALAAVSHGRAAKDLSSSLGDFLDALLMHIERLHAQLPRSGN